MHASGSNEDSSSQAHMWDVLGRGDVSSGQAVESRIEEVRSALKALPESRLADFQRWLASRLFDIDRRAYAEIPARLSDGSEMKQSSDSFLYARCACILAGEESWRDIIEGNASFSAFTATASQGCRVAALSCCRGVRGTVRPNREGDGWSVLRNGFQFCMVVVGCEIMVSPTRKAISRPCWNWRDNTCKIGETGECCEGLCCGVSR
jgi:Protein of unknown function (DUF4240)